MQPPPPANGPLDRSQLERIRATHSGYLYQHLHAVAQLLTNANENGFLSVEYSEDVEINDGTTHTYAQIKHYASDLQPSHIASAMERFSILRSDHAKGTRQGSCSFAIVCSSEPSASLSKQESEGTWPGDVLLATPQSRKTVGAVPAWPSLNHALDWCVTMAAQVPFSKLSPETLVWKLTAYVLAVASGRLYNKEHRVPFADLPRIREQMDLFADALPPTPVPYRPQRDEPPARTESRVRAITGVSGSGKTAWISAAAQHFPGLVAFARASSGTADVSSWIVRTLSARLLPANENGLAAVFRPGLASEEALRLLDAIGARTPVLLVVDNAHLLDAKALASCVQATRALEWILLGQPGPTIAELKARLSLNDETLGGWDESAIVSACHALRVSVSAETASDLRELTAGVPLYVESTARAAAAHYSGNVDELLKERRRGKHVVGLPQESLVARDVMDSLSANARDLATVLSFAKSQMTRVELSNVATAALALAAGPAGSCVRELVEWAVLRPGPRGTLGLHDVFRPAADAAKGQLAPDVRARGLHSLLAVLRARTDVAGDIDRALDIVRLLAELGDGAGVVDLVYGTIEWFREHGMEKDVEHSLELVVDRPGLDAELAFLGADALSFMAVSCGDADRAAQYMRKCETLAAAQAIRKPDWEARLAVKRILIAMVARDKEAARAAYGDYSLWAVRGTEGYRVATYNYAMALRACDENEGALWLLNSLVKEYFSVFSLGPGDLYAKNVPGLEQLFDRQKHADEIRHFADCLDMRARVASDLGVVADLQGMSGLDAMWATKLYTLVGAFSSAMRAGVEAARNMRLLGTVASAAEAVRFCETALVPNLTKERMIQWIVPVCLEYAQALALVGRLRDARSQLRAIAMFVPSLPRADQQLVDRIGRWVEDQDARNAAALEDGLVALTDGVRRIMRGEFDQYGVRRDAMQIMVEEVAWFERSDKTRIGVVVRDRTDNDYGWVTLEYDGSCFSWDRRGNASFPEPQAAASDLVAALLEDKSDE